MLKLIVSPLLNVVNQLLKRLLPLSPASTQALTKIVNRCLVIEVSDLSLQLALSVHNQTIQISTQSPKQVDCQLSGELSTLLQLQDPTTITQLIQQQQLVVNGDLQVAQAFMQCLQVADIDWQEHLSQYIGDAMAYRVSRLIHGMNQAFNKQLVLQKQLLSQFAQDEWLLTPHPLEVQEYQQQVDSLRAQTDRLQHRFNRLHVKIIHGD